MKEREKPTKENGSNLLGLTSVNHISIICRSLEKSLDFYQNVLGFFPVRRPRSLNFLGAWLFNYGIGIHLLQVDHLGDTLDDRVINPKDYHISFQCEDMSMVEKMLQEMTIKYVKSRVTETDTSVDQLYFHDPDGLVIEICNCNNNLPDVPKLIRSSSLVDPNPVRP